LVGLVGQIGWSDWLVRLVGGWVNGEWGHPAQTRASYYSLLLRGRGPLLQRIVEESHLLLLIVCNHLAVGSRSWIRLEESRSQGL
jgi:hypothetical protein